MRSTPIGEKEQHCRVRQMGIEWIIHEWVKWLWLRGWSTRSFFLPQKKRTGGNSTYWKRLCMTTEQWTSKTMKDWGGHRTSMESNKSDVFSKTSLTYLEVHSIYWCSLERSLREFAQKTRLEVRRGKKEWEGEFVSFHPYLCSRSRAVIDSTMNGISLGVREGRTIPGVI